MYYHNLNIKNKQTRRLKKIYLNTKRYSIKFLNIDLHICKPI